MSPKRWFDNHLKGTSNDIDTLPAVTYYVMGPLDGSSPAGNKWKHADTWPVPACETSWFLTADGSLSKAAADKASSLSYESNPCNPVPTIGGRNLFLPSGPRDQREIENRDDVIVFTSPPLQEDLEVTGHLMAKIYFSTDVSDTDVVVRLTDVYPDGRSILISDGIYRTATGIKKDGSGASAPKDGWQGIQELSIDLWSTSTVFAKGHSIRISICGSNYPRYEKNLNIGVVGSNSGKCRTAKHTIHTGIETPSRIILPVIK